MRNNLLFAKGLVVTSYLLQSIYSVLKLFTGLETAAFIA